jgi:hypothetical protein
MEDAEKGIDHRTFLARGLLRVMATGIAGQLFA